MKDLRLAAFLFGLAALTGTSATASPAGDIAGTWECRQPGIQYNNKPPILYIADAGNDQVTIEVDGFSREIYGRSEVFADADGWFKVKPAQGQQFMIRPEAAAKQKTASMGVRFGDAKSDFRCLRLPLSGTPASVPAPAQGAPAAESAPPAAAEPGSAPAASGQPPAPQPGTPSEGAVKKDY